VSRRIGLESDEQAALDGALSVVEVRAHCSHNLPVASPTNTATAKPTTLASWSVGYTIKRDSIVLVVSVVVAIVVLLLLLERG